MDVNELGSRLAQFASSSLFMVPQFYEDALLNYLAVTLRGSHEHAVDVLIEALLEDSKGDYSPIGRKEKLSLGDCCKVDCFSSAILAYDDIHFATTTHPCGPVASAILAISRKQKVSLDEAIEALCAGMEVECRIATALFDATDCAPGWYTTGVAGVFGAAVGAGRLLGFDVKMMESVLGLAASYASGIRGTHGSMAGSFVPAIAAKNGYEAAMLVAHGFTCNLSALTGSNGLILQITRNPDIEKAIADLGTVFMSQEVSAKPYPLGFISFAPIECAKKFSGYKGIEEVSLEVSNRLAILGSNPIPKTMYEGFVSLPYVVAKTLVDDQLIIEPLSEKLTISREILDLIEKVKIRVNQQLRDEEARLTIRIGKQTYSSICTNALGSKNNPMKHEDILEKCQKLIQNDNWINGYYQNTIDDLYKYIGGLS